MRTRPPLAFRLDLVSRPHTRSLFVKLFFVLSLVSFLLLLASLFTDAVLLPLVIEKTPILGVLYITTSFFLAFCFVEFYYRSHLVPFGAVTESGLRVTLAPEAARVFSYMGGGFGTDIRVSDFLAALNKTIFLRIFLVRLGIAEEDFALSINQKRAVASVRIERLLSEGMLTLSAIFVFCASEDEVLKNFFFQREVKPEILSGAAEWVESEIEECYARARWLLRKNLERIPGIAKDLGYGYTYNLERYASEVLPRSTRFARYARVREIEAVEEALARSREANVLLVGEAGSGKHTVVEGFAGLIYEGRVKPVLEHKRVMMLDAESITARATTKSSYEGVMITILAEAVGAGNIILVIENFPGFLASAREMGADALDILGHYISGPNLQVIALSETGAFHRDLEPNGLVAKLFEKVEMREVESNTVIYMLESSCSELEAATGKVFTYQALVRAEDLARRFIAEGVMPEKAINLLDDAASMLPSENRLVRAEDIDAVVTRRTAIPTAVAEEAESEKLLKLEQLLHEKVINQEHAVSVISDSLRRARAGLGRGRRPIGSFLFLGPTGVGKTETARSLAEIYFGGEEAMLRFDMSEFQGEDGLEKLTGSFEMKEPGVLASRLRERPFGLLLFDEFEKSSHDVRNLFLQVLDEGVFHDAFGRTVSARETIVIATSNAGANTVWELLKEGKDPSEVQEAVIDEIRKEGVLSPELLNRFDAVVVFHPLSPEQLEQVALLLLRDLARQLEKQDVHFVPSRDLARRIVEIGYDKTFGARPMRRAIQDHVEQLIARKILEGTLKRGDSFSLNQAEIDKL